MDWGSERYIRLFSRDTGTWLELRWEARAVLPLLMRKVDRDGHLSIPSGAKPEAVVAKAIDVPARIALAGLAGKKGLCEFGVVEVTTAGVTIVNFVPAQETPSKAIPGAVRTAEWRRRKKGQGDAVVTSSDEPSLSVTPSDGRDDDIRDVTNVTPSVLVPSEPSVPSKLSAGAQAREISSPPPEVRARESIAEQRAADIERVRERLTYEVLVPEVAGAVMRKLPVRPSDIERLLDAGEKPDDIVETAQWLSAEITARRCSRDAWGSAFYRGWYDSFRLQVIPEKFQPNTGKRGPIDPASQDHSGETPF